MSLTLENPYLQLVLPDTNPLSWSLYSRSYPQTYFEHARLKVAYRLGEARPWITHLFQKSTETHTAAVGSPHGRLAQVIQTGASSDGWLNFTLTFALPEQASCLLWKLNIENVGPVPLQIGPIELLHLDPQGDPNTSNPTRFQFGPGLKTQSALAFYSNGWQSWNYTGVYGPFDRFRSTRLGPFTSPMRVNSGRPRPKAPGHLVSDMFGVLGDREQRLGGLLGFLSQQEHFGSIETHLRGQASDLRLWANGDGARLDPGQHMTTDWAYLSFINLDDADPLGSYFEAVARQHDLLPPFTDEFTGGSEHQWPATPTGWCSWYNFFGKVTAHDIRSNLEAARQFSDRLPLEVIQIDDGFETKVGDWSSFRSTFPDGLASLAEEIKGAGFTPGIWLAPFIVVPSSKIAASHPEWLLRGRLNLPVNAGYSSWGEFSTALDLTHPDALRYAQEVVQTAAQKWGFPYLKLDFLYAGALPGKHLDPTRSRAQVLRKGLQALRDCLDQDVALLGCGCPLGPAIGLVDAMRIGADVSDRWKPAFVGVEFFFEAEPDYPSTRNALQNILTRSGMHHRWWVNDPDCLLVRPDSRLSLDEIQTLATAITLSGGSLFLSDDLPALSEDRIQLAASLLPLLPDRMRIIDWFDSITPTRLRLDLQNQTGRWSLLAFFNWNDQSADFSFDPAAFGLSREQAYWVRDYWHSETIHLPPQESRGHLQKAIAPHGVRLLAVRTAQNDKPSYLGSNLHISQGLEVVRWVANPGNLKVQLERPARSQGEIEIYLPGTLIQQAALNGDPIRWQARGDGRFIFYLDFAKAAELQLVYKSPDSRPVK